MNKVNPEHVVPKEFTLASFLNNPTGDAGTNAIARKLVLEQYSNQMNALLKAGRKFDTKMVQAGQSLFIKVDIPSETFKDFHYEVVIEFVDADLSKTTLNDTNIRFFSNSPSFTFTYANVFDLFGLLSLPFKKKYTAKVFEELPDTRNPDFQTFYEKSITMALLWIRENGLLNISSNKTNYRRMPLGKIAELVSTAEQKVEEYKELRKTESETKKKEKALAAAKRKLEKNSEKESASFKTDQKVTGRKTTSGISSRKTSNKVERSVANTKINRKVDNKVKSKVK